MKYILLILSLLLIPSFAGITYGHTVDAVGEYRVEIGWMNEPVVSGETNALELYVSPLVDCPDISISMECANSQEFQNGIEGLRKLLKVQFQMRNYSKRRKARRTIILIAIFSIFSIAISSYFVNKIPQSEIIAEVNGYKILKSDLQNKITESLGKEFINFKNRKIKKRMTNK